VGTIDTGMARGNRGYGVLDRAPVPPGGDGRAVSQTLDAVLHKGQTMPEKNRFPAVLQPVIESELYSIMPMNSGKDYKARKVEVTQPLMGAGPVGGNQGGDYIVQPLDVLPFDTTQITSPGNFSSPNYGDPSHPLAAGAHPPSVVYSVALRGREGGGTAELGDDLAGCLRASSGGGDKPHVLTPTIAFQERGRSEGRSLEINGDLSYALTAPSGGGRGQERNILDGVTMAVRRLMPVECERLQGFPDNWTAVPVKKVASNKMRPGNSYAEINAEIWQLAADGPRYKQCGNSMATKVMRWIGSRVAWHLSTRLPGHNGGPPLDDFDLMLGLGVPDPMDAVIG